MRRLGDKDLSTLPLRILFHINEFRNGGTETSLMSWLRTLDRRYFILCLVVTYPTQELEAWKTLAIPADVPVHVLAASARMHALHQAYRAGAFGVGAKLLYNLLTYGVIRPLIARRLRRLAEAHDLACDYDLSLRHIAGNTTVPWFAVSHISLKARHAGKNAAWVARRLRHSIGATRPSPR